MRKGIGVIFFLFVFSLVWGADLTLQGKKVLFYVDSASGNFYMESPAPSTEGLKQLLFKDIPPTSYVTLIYNNQPYKLTDGKLKVVEGFKVNGNTISSLFQIENAEFRVSFVLTNAVSKEENDTVICLVSAKNKGQEKITIGARFLFDTFYDERWGNPYLYLASSEEIKYERLLREESTPNFIFSGIYNAGDRIFQEGLFIYPYINSFRPDSIIIGNWKKLDEIELDYKVDPRGKFKYNDFANKDAAVAIFFRGIYVNTDEEVNIGCVLASGQFENKGFYEKPVEIAPITETPPVTNQPEVAVVEPPVTNIITNTNVVVPVPVVATNVPATNIAKPPVKMTVVTNYIQPSEYDLLRKEKELQLLQSQVELMERLMGLLDRVDGMLTNRSALPPVEKTAPPVTATNKAPETVKAVETAVTNTPVKPVKTGKSTEEYEAELRQQKEHYEELIQQQERDFEKISSDYASKLKEYNKLKSRNEKIRDLNDTIQLLDQKIKIIEELEKLNLDFASMPQDEVDKLHREIEVIERNLLKLKNK